MDTRTIEIDCPEDLRGETDPEHLRRMAREAFYVRLCQEGKVSSGRAGALLGMSKSEVLDLLGRYGVSYFDEHADLTEDLDNAKRARI